MTYDPSMRVLTVLELLQSRERMTGGELCRRLEVSPRTVQRYVARLQDLGIPVESTRGVGGSYRLRPGFRLPPLMFSGEEALALALGLRALRLLGLDALTPAALSASAKLARTLPPLLSERVQALQDAVQLDVAPWVLPADAEALSLLLRAVELGQPAHFSYRRGEQPQERVAEIFGTAHVYGRWYVVAHCRAREGLRTFRLDRMSALRLMEGTSRRPADFDALVYLRQSMPEAVLGPLLRVQVHAPPDVVRPMLSSWGVTLSPLEGGHTLLIAHRERLTPFAANLLGLGLPLTVLEPPELRQEYALLAERCLQAAMLEPV